MQDATERESKVKESVEKAKDAVAMDVKDGISWSMSNILPININIHYFPPPLLLPLSPYSDPWKCVPIFVLLKSARLQGSQAVCLRIQPGGGSLLPQTMPSF